jgi:hypothetical protein
MTEKFLHYLWKMKLLRNQELRTVTGDRVQILSTGEHNTNAGPDFSNARIKLGDTLWAGNVEIHLKSSEWNIHNHDTDPDYDNIILHAVFEDDETILRKDGTAIPCLEMKDLFDAVMYETYQALMQSNDSIPCHAHISRVDPIILSQWLQTVDGLSGWKKRFNPFFHALEENKHNWEETFYSFMAQAFGAKINAEPFRLLARATPLKVLAKHKNSLLQIEALLFGGAGFLDEKFCDDYPNQLKKEYSFLKKKYGLTSIKKHTWKFLRLRPANFPTIRIAQFAWLIYQSSHLFSQVIEQENMNKMSSYFW